jgi:acyl carrier protein
MSEENVEMKIKEMIVERLFLDVAPEDIGDEDALMEKYDIDSVRLFEIVIGIEDVFGVVIDEADFDVEVFRDVKSIAGYIRTKKAG